MAHAGALRRVGGDDLTAEFIQNDWRKADLTEAERAMLEWAEKLTLTPSAMTQEDIQKLRDVGWEDRDILDIAHVSAYFNYRVRMVDGLGLPVSDMAADQGFGGAGTGERLGAGAGCGVAGGCAGGWCSRRKGRSRWRPAGKSAILMTTHRGIHAYCWGNIWYQPEPKRRPSWRMTHECLYSWFPVWRLRYR